MFTWVHLKRKLLATFCISNSPKKSGNFRSAPKITITFFSVYCMTLLTIQVNFGLLHTLFGKCSIHSTFCFFYPYTYWINKYTVIICSRPWIWEVCPFLSIYQAKMFTEECIVLLCFYCNYYSSTPYNKLNWWLSRLSAYLLITFSCNNWWTNLDMVIK